MDREELLSLLINADRPISGEAMSEKLGVSRTAVWKAIEELRAEGYEISSAPRRGYSLKSSPDVLSEAEIRNKIRDCSKLGSSIMILDEVDSTNTECKRQANAGAAEGLVVTSEYQSGGRGRRGHGFLSPKGKGIYLSVLLRPELPPQETVGITAWIAVAMCDAVEEAYGVRPGIKWTNDLVLGGRKLCGILTEMEVEAESRALRFLIPGIGINCNHQPEDFSEDIRDFAGSIAMHLGHPVHRADLVASMIRALDRMYAAFPEGKQEYLEKYRKDCVTIGRDVKLISLDGTVEEAFAENVADDFSLVVRLKDGSHKNVNTGDVSVRGLWGYV